MRIEYLSSRGFVEVEKIDELKISKGEIKFSANNLFSKTVTPDLRYYWDGERFGLHVSDCDYKEPEFHPILKSLHNEQIIESLSILYISRTTISKYNLELYNYSNLEYLYLSSNLNLNRIIFGDISKLREFYCFGCPKLKTIELKGSYLNLIKLDVSRSGLNSLIVGNAPQLEYLNIQNNEIVDINISQFSNLKYFFAEGNSNLKIEWPKKWIHNKLEILGLNESNELISKDILEIAENTSDNELREKLKAYLKFEQKHVEELVPINRHQIILLGNTTAGKTELRHRLFDKTRTDFDSTHGVQYFLEKIGDIEVMGYDFGGQDYYHALHLPFFDTFSHYILVWGNHRDITWGNFYSYFGKKEKLKGENNAEVENLLYPIEYWLKSIQHEAFRENKMQMYNSKHELNKHLDFVSRINHAKENSLDITTEEIAMEIFKPNEKEPIVDIIQNVRERTSEQYLNIKDLKSTRYVRVQDVLNFNFSKPLVGEWLREKIANGIQTQKNQIVQSIKDFGEQIYQDGAVILEKSEIVEKIKISTIQDSESNVDVIINSLINNHYLIFPGKIYHELKDYYIVNIQKFSEYIYQVLSKELAACEKDQGYFTKEEAFTRIKNDDLRIKEYIIEFLKKSEVIFEVDDSESQNPKYVAPTYLSIPREKIEMLFIESFEKPDCEFEFQSFFHPNIILQVVKYYKEKGLLVKDDEKIEYLLWKNCVIIYNNNKESKHYLKLELLLPNKDFPNRNPTFTISRSSAGFIENDQFSEVFKEIKTLLSQYTPRIKVKTPYGKYIPFHDIQKLISEGVGKKSQFVYSDGVLYPKYDFRHFLPDEFNAPLKLFIAYSKFDDEYRLELRDHLYPGISEGKFIVFDDREMDLGEKWHARLKKELEQCDVFVVLISVKTLGTPYVMNVEIPAAKERLAKSNLTIIPILVSPCDWTKTGLTELNIYDKANPITSQNENLDLSKELSVNERATKWKEIVKQIENITPNGQ